MIYIKSLIDSKVGVIDKDGMIHAMGRVNNSKYHIKLLLNYLLEKHPTLDISKLNVGSPRNYYGYIFGKFRDIIYFNDNSTGMFYFPDELTLNQIDTLYNLDLGRQKVAICYDLKITGNNINDKMIGLDGEHSLNEALEEFMNKQSTKSWRR